MIAFLTICYIAVLALLVKVKVVRLNLFWKISPLLWLVFLLIVLFIPMQWGAPSGAVTLYKPVIEVIPNVSGEVISVEAEPRKPMKKGDVIFRIDPTVYDAKVEELQARKALAAANLERAEDLMAKNVGRQYEVDQYTAEIQSLGAQLKDARWELEKTTVIAPTDGYVIGLTLRPGQRVGRLAVRSWAAFVDTQHSYLIVGIDQNRLRHVRAGQPAEVTLKMFPGRIFNARVKGIGLMTPEGQLSPTGNIPLAPTGWSVAQPHAVELELLDELALTGMVEEVPGGSVGTATIYTSSAKMTHLIRKVILRMDAWLNYIIPY